MTTHKDNIWNGDYKIPWGDPDFSRRMLAEHLSQDHDLASRRMEWVDKQVAWIHAELLACEPSRILDLGCGPGFYSHRLGVLGHRCWGIDLGPASVEYAQQHNPEQSPCEFALGDIRYCDYGTSYDLAMVLYGELNVFAPDEALAILRKAHASLTSQGRLIIEVQAPEAIEGMGRAEASEHELEAGLFSDGPHSWRTENEWLPDQRVAVQTFTVTEASGGQARIYRSTTQAWSDAELIVLLTDAGFEDVAKCSDWPSNTEALSLWGARKK